MRRKTPQADPPSPQPLKKLGESEALFRALVENAPIGISFMRPDHTFEYFNPRFTELFGCTLEDLPDKDTWFRKPYPDPAYRREAVSFWKKDLVDQPEIGRAFYPIQERDPEGENRTSGPLKTVTSDG